MDGIVPDYVVLGTVALATTGPIWSETPILSVSIRANFDYRRVTPAPPYTTCVEGGEVASVGRHMLPPGLYREGGRPM